MLEEINSYAGLINIALFGTIIGFLIHISRISRTSIIDKYEAKTESLVQQIDLLKAQEIVARQNNEAVVDLLERQLEFQKSITDLPDEQKVALIKAEYEGKLAELEQKISTRKDTDAAFGQEVELIEAAAKRVSNDPSTGAKAAMEVLSKVIATLVKIV